MDIEGVFALAVIFVGLPWLILHYVTRWKTAATLTNDDETMLEELYQLARRLEERMETVERLAAASDPDFMPAPRNGDNGTVLDSNSTKERIGR